MAREKYSALTEQMFYILLALEQERCGVDIVGAIHAATEGRMVIGPGTLYTLLADFQKSGYIEETAVEGRRRSYRITETGRELVEGERQRLARMLADYERMREGEKL